MPDRQIARLLNRSGKPTGRGNGWTEQRVSTMIKNNVISGWAAYKAGGADTSTGGVGEKVNWRPTMRSSFNDFLKSLPEVPSNFDGTTPSGTG